MLAPLACIAIGPECEARNQLQRLIIHPTRSDPGLTLLNVIVHPPQHHCAAVADILHRQSSSTFPFTRATALTRHWTHLQYPPPPYIRPLYTTTSIGKTSSIDLVSHPNATLCTKAAHLKEDNL